MTQDDADLTAERAELTAIADRLRQAAADYAAKLEIKKKADQEARAAMAQRDQLREERDAAILRLGGRVGVRELAADSGVDPGNVSRMLTGSATPPPKGPVNRRRS